MPKKKPDCPAAPAQANQPVGSPAAPCPGPNPQVVQRGNVTITTDRVAKTITMTGTQQYYGPGASQAYADSATQSINNTWTGPTTFEGQPYNVTSNIQGTYRQESDPATAGANQINVVHTTVPAGDRNGDPANQPYYASSPGHQHDTEDSDGGLTRAHEFGHSMGLPDEYSEGPRDSNGNRTIVRTGPAGGLMGYIESTSRPTPDNYAALITGCGLH